LKLTRKAGKIEALRETIKGLDGAQARVGWFPSAMYEGNKPVAGIAAVHEFGSPSRGIPPRPFMRPTATEKRSEWKQIAAQLTKAAANGNIAPSDIMDAVAQAARGHVNVTITKLTAPALKKATIDARKRRQKDGGKSAEASIEKPLNDTGYMLATLSYEVTK
jgi:phage gpG-like protein